MKIRTLHKQFCMWDYGIYKSVYKAEMYVTMKVDEMHRLCLKH